METFNLTESEIERLITAGAEAYREEQGKIFNVLGGIIVGLTFCCGVLTGKIYLARKEKKAP